MSIPEGEQLLITGDTLVGEAVHLIRMGKDPYINTINKLMQLPVKLLIQSHPHEAVIQAWAARYH
jgi:glyoxylase-like metal-dependent hydrolase (beta-lactamase superfamily II)